jgi:hypothetical protein
MITNLTKRQRKAIARCKKDPVWFIENFCNITHPSAGIIPLKLFSYQKKSIKIFQDPKNRYCIYHKVRQSGISTLCGAYALWYAMFNSDKTILIVSKKDDDAKDFLRKNVRFIYDFLPKWMREVWSIDPDRGGNNNVHELVFPNGSRIVSLTAAPTVMRSHAASLYIIDESAFIQDMDRMWEGAAPTLTHGGRCIVISTPNGMGNWYARTVRDAQHHKNDFKLIEVDWWDMDWQIRYRDEFGNDRLIAPTHGIRKSTPDEMVKYGGSEWVSPWLEEQYRILSSDGDDKKFRQEVMHEFLGTGDTILTRETLARMNKGVAPPEKMVGKVSYKSPNTEEVYPLDFKNKLWIWQRPVRGDEKKGELPHIYTLGADCSPGEGDGDPSAIVVWDLNTKEQVAELELRVDTKTFAKMIDFLGRAYNDALVIVERDAWGQTVLKELTEVLVYHNLFRFVKEKNNLKKVWERYGYPPGTLHKAAMNANMVQCLSSIGGFKTKSERLCREAEIYIQINAVKVGAEPGHGNHDDIIIAAGIGLVAVAQAFQTANPILIPMESRNMDDFMSEQGAPGPWAPPAVIQRQVEATLEDRIQQRMMSGGKNCIIPYIGAVESGPSGDYQQNIAREVMKFAKQIGQVPSSIPQQSGGAVVIPPKYRKK